MLNICSVNTKNGPRIHSIGADARPLELKFHLLHDAHLIGTDAHIGPHYPSIMGCWASENWVLNSQMLSKNAELSWFEYSNHESSAFAEHLRIQYCILRCSAFPNSELMRIWSVVMRGWTSAFGTRWNCASALFRHGVDAHLVGIDALYRLNREVRDFTTRITSIKNGWVSTRIKISES